MLLKLSKHTDQARNTNQESSKEIARLNVGLRRLIVEVSRSFSIRHPLPHTHTHTHTHTYTLSRTPLNEGSVRRRDLYLTTHSTYNRQTSMTPVRLEPAIPASKLPNPRLRPRGDLDRRKICYRNKINYFLFFCNVLLYSAVCCF
jgi:hypothetical protein